MARPPRRDFPGAFHHVMNRGADHQNIFTDYTDRRIFLKLWEIATSRFGIEVITFALMGNHFHVFVHSPDAQLSATMQYIGRAYTQIYNQRHGRDGALFRGRFHSVLIESETHLARVARYVELNPVAAGLCSISDLYSYEWSSFRYSSGAYRTPGWLSPEHLRSRFGSPSDYRQFVESGAVDIELRRFYDNQAQMPGAILGSDEFIATISRQSSDDDPQTNEPAGDRATPDQIESLVRRLCGATDADIFNFSRPVHPARRAAILLSQSLTGIPRQQLAERYGFSTDEAFITSANRARSASNYADIAWLCEAATETLRPPQINRRV